LDYFGTLKNTGKLTLNSTGTGAVLGSNGTLTGGGRVLLSDDAANFILGGALTNFNNTISGAGIIQVKLKNEAKGLINATGKINPLIISTSEIVTNFGILAATGPAGLVIKDKVDDWPSGIIQALVAGSPVSLQGATIVGGMLKMANGGVIRVDGTGSTSTLDGSTPGAPVTIIGNLVVTGGSPATANKLALAGTINNKGSIILNVNGKLLVMPGGYVERGAVLQGGGKVVLKDSVLTDGTAAPKTLLNLDNTISGAGAIGSGNLTLINGAKGVIDATDFTTSLVLGFVSSPTVTNLGLLEATGGAVLDIQALVENGPSGVVQAVGVGSRVKLDWGGLVGGTLKTANGGVITVGATVTYSLDGSTVYGPVVNAGRLVVDDGKLLLVAGTLSNKGSIAINGFSVLPTELVIAAVGVALQGGGKVTLTDNVNNIIDSSSAGETGMTLRNLDNTIAGAGNIGNGHVSLVNATLGVINATDASNSLIINSFEPALNAGLMEATGAVGMKIVSGMVNTGTLKAAAAGTLFEIDGALTNNGKLQASNGTIYIKGGISGAGTATINFGGTLEFDGTGITQNVTFANAGAGKATLQFNATATANPNLIYDGVISGFSSPSDQIDLTGLTFSGNTSLTKTLVGGNTVIELTESGNVVDLTLAGNHMADHFVVKQDSGTGTLVFDPPAQTSSQNPLNNIASLFSQFISSWTNTSAALTSEAHVPLGSEFLTAMSLPHAHG
jgi:hypothetical protein